VSLPAAALRAVPLLGWRRRPWRVVERNVVAYRQGWYIFLSGFLEPLLFLLSIGVGVGTLVGDVRSGGEPLDYRLFVAPAMMASTAMNGAILDTTFNFFVKYKYGRLYDGVVATPMEPRDVAAGEVTWALLRGGIYATGFLLTMVAFGDVRSWWVVLAVPVAVLISFAFASAGLAATTFMRSFLDFEFVNMTTIPLFLFSATFFPLHRYPEALQLVVRATPLYQGVALERALVLGHLHWTLLLHAAYLVTMGAVGLHVAARRVRVLLNK
jgi:lipooligosaccharide transport system permease protein